MTSIGKVLKLYRVKNSLSQSGLAETLEISVNFLSQIENDKCSFSSAKLEEVAKKLGLSKELLVIISSEAPFELSPKQKALFLKMQESLLQGLLV